jgi:hypothetical protein
MNTTYRLNRYATETITLCRSCFGNQGGITAERAAHETPDACTCCGYEPELIRFEECTNTRWYRLDTGMVATVFGV